MKLREIEYTECTLSFSQKTKRRPLSSAKKSTLTRPNLALVKSKDTHPEILVRKRLHHLGFRFRLHQRVGDTRPDIVLRRWNCCIFVHGCFWHRHQNCSLAYNPKTNTEFWRNKFETNVRRDESNVEELRSLGWNVGVIWECATRNGHIKDANFNELLSSTPLWQIP